MISPLQHEINETSANGGGTVFLDSMTVSQFVTLPENIELQGKHPFVVIKADDNFSASTLSGMRPAMFVSEGTQNIKMKNLIIDANGANQQGRLCGVCIQDATDVEISDVIVKNAGAEGSRESQSVWIRNSSRIRVHNLIEENCDGITVSMSNDFEVSDCKSFDSSSEGIFIGASSKGSVSNNYITRAKGAGISVTGSGGLTSDVIVIGNQTHECGQSTLDQSDNPTSAVFNGISIGQNVSDIVISSNISTNNFKSGIGVNTGSRITVVGNITKNNALSGFRQEQSTDVVLAGNFFPDGNQTT